MNEAESDEQLSRLHARGHGGRSAADARAGRRRPAFDALFEAAREQVPDAEEVVGNKGYDSWAIKLQELDADPPPHIPSTMTATEPWEHDEESSKERDRAERLIGKMKQFRAVATRYDKRAASFLATVKWSRLASQRSQSILEHGIGVALTRPPALEITMTDRPTRRSFLAVAGAVSSGLFARSQEPPLAPPDKQPPSLLLPEVPARKVGWAVVGIGQLALEQVMPAFGQCKLSVPTALVSGHPDKAKRVAQAYGVDAKHLYDYDSFDRLRDDPTVDVVYILLPNSMHAEYTIRALKAGKHVLCEKPMAANVAECEAMMAAADEAKKKLMIAYRLHYEPFNRTAMKLCAEKAVGEIRSISTSNCQVTKAPNIRLSKQLAGGPLQDIGIYGINACRYLTREEPVEVTAFEHRSKDPRFREVPAGVSFTLRFPSGVVANGDCSFDAAESRRYRVQGTEGFVEMDPAFSYSGLKLNVSRAGKLEQHKLTEVNHFSSEMDHFSLCVLQDKPPLTPGREGLADLRIISAIEQAAATGKAVEVKSS